MLGYLGFSALAVQEDRSFFEPGKRVASPLVSIADDGRDPAGLPVGFDAEGVPKQRLALLDAGVCCDLVVRRADRGPRRPPLDRPRAPRPEPLRPVPDQHGHGRRATRRSTSWSAASIAACS